MIESGQIVLLANFVILLVYKIHKKEYVNKNRSKNSFSFLEENIVSLLVLDFLILFLFQKFLVFLYEPFTAGLILCFIIPFMLRFQYQRLPLLISIFYFHEFFIFLNQSVFLRADIGLLLLSLLILFLSNHQASRKALIISIVLISTKSFVPYTSVFLLIACIVLFIDGIKMLEKRQGKKLNLNIYMVLSDLYILAFMLYSNSFTKTTTIFFTILFVIRYFYDILDKKIDLNLLLVSRLSLGLLVFEGSEKSLAVLAFYGILWVLELKDIFSIPEYKKGIKHKDLDSIDIDEGTVLQLPFLDSGSGSLNILNHDLKWFNEKEKRLEYLSSSNADKDMINITKMNPEYILFDEDFSEYYSLRVWVQDFFKIEKDLGEERYLFKARFRKSELTFILYKEKLDKKIIRVLEDNLHEKFPYAQIIEVENENTEYHFDEHIILVKQALVFESKEVLNLLYTDKYYADENLSIIPNYNSTSSIKKLSELKYEYQKMTFVKAVKLENRPFFVSASNISIYEKYYVSLDPEQELKNIVSEYLIFIGDLKTIKRLLESDWCYSYDLIISSENKDLDKLKYDYGLLSLVHFDYLSTNRKELISFLDNFFIKNDTDSVSIIIPYYNNGLYTYHCIKSIQANTNTIPYEILLIDNASQDKWYKKIQRIKGIRYYRNSENLGFSGAVNTGLRLAKGTHLLVFNNDIVVGQNWLEKLIEPIRRNELDVVGPVTNEISGPQKIDLNYFGLDEYHIKSKKYSEKNKSRLIRTDRIVGFCMLFRRSLFNDLGYFDERFKIGNFEDDDFCIRLNQKNYRIGYTHGVYIHHYGSISFKKSDLSYDAILNTNREKFLSKWSKYLKQSKYSIYHLIKDYAVFKAYEHFDNEQLKSLDYILKELKRKQRHIHFIELSKLLQRLKKFPEAKAIITEGLKHYPHSFLLKLYRINLDYDTGNFSSENSIEYSELLKNLSNYSLTYYIECSELLKAGKIDSLMSRLRIIENKDPFTDFAKLFREEVKKIAAYDQA